MDETTNWDDLRLFLAVARAGGLSGAARATGKSAPTLGRRMLALEQRLGDDLFFRLPRGYALTEAGQRFLDNVAAVERDIAPLAAPAPRGQAPVVKLSAGLWVTHLLCQHVDELVGGDPIRLRFIAADQVVDIARREALIGVRNHRPEDTGLAGRRIGRVRFATYARDPDVATWARVVGNTPSARWVQAESAGQTAIEVTSPRSALDLALAGAARIVLPIFIGQRFDVLQQTSAPITALDHDQWLVTHHEDRFVPEVRRVIDRLATVLKREIV